MSFHTTGEDGGEPTSPPTPLFHLSLPVRGDIKPVGMIASIDFGQPLFHHLKINILPIQKDYSQDAIVTAEAIPFDIDILI